MTSASRNLLFVVPRGRLYPSSCKRVYELVPLFERRGFGVRVLACEWEWLWTTRMRADGGSWVARQMLRTLNATRVLPRLMRLRDALVRRRFERLVRWSDVVIVNKHILHDSWAAVLATSRRPVVYEFDDAVWLENEPGLLAMLRSANTVVVGNTFLANYARRFHEQVHIIPTGIRLDRYEAQTSDGSLTRCASPDRYTIGWVGSPSTVRYLEILVEPLAEIGRRLPITLEIVGAGNAALPTFRNINLCLHSSIPYDPVNYVPRFDVGVMPLFDGDFEQGKCGAKALEYMAAGIPSVCSPVGENIRIVHDGIDGFLAGPADEWVRKLSLLLADAATRKRVGEAGRNKVRSLYSADLVVSLWMDVVENTVQKRGETKGR